MNVNPGNRSVSQLCRSQLPKAVTAIGILGALCLMPYLAFAQARILPPFPVPSGTIVEATDRDWGSIVLKENQCVLVNNVWNKGAAGGDFQQEIFTKSLHGALQPGWRWRAPWQKLPQVISQPQLVCGDKPWDLPRHLISEFPFRVGTKRLVVDFEVQLDATGTYNMAFTLWAVRSLPSSRESISHEIMIWNVRSGQFPAGRQSGSIRVGDVVYDLFLKQNHEDASGANANTWTYVAFVAREPVLHGPVDLSAFTRYLTELTVLPPDSYITSLELGNEVCSGVGLVEVPRLSLRFE